MKRSRFSEQIIGILKEHQAGLAAVELCRKKNTMLRARGGLGRLRGFREALRRGLLDLLLGGTRHLGRRR